MHLVINIQKLEEHARQCCNLTGRLCTLKVTQLTGGFVTLGMYRLDLAFQLPDHRIETASYVQKFTTIGEVRIMQALADIPEAGAIPRVIDCGYQKASDDERYAHWFIIPFYNGVELTWDDDVPAIVMESLAQLHVHFRTRVQSIDYLHIIDRAFFRRTFDNALEAVAKAQQEKSDSRYQEAFLQLTAARDNQQLYEVLASLPLTLAHGDVHPGNIIHEPGASTMLIDWGNARIAPAMLDIANMVELHSSNWATYITAWETASEEVMDLRMAQLGYHWATIMVNTQYLPYAIEYTSPENVEKMITKVINAQEKIADLY
jgi:thiamine kinase-like enzyme